MRFLYLALAATQALFASSESTSDFYFLTSESEKEKHTLSCEYVIYPSDVAGDGFVIDKEGEWCFAYDIDYDPVNSNPAITIKVSNVTLDLNGKQLTQNSKNQPFVVGIAVASDVSNVHITNGVVSNFSQAGIFVNPPAATTAKRMVGTKSIQAKTGKNLIDMAGENLSTEPVSGVTISEITAENNGRPNLPFAGINGMGGIIIFNSSNVSIYECSCLNNYFSGITGLDVVDFFLEDSVCENSKASFLIGTNSTFALGALITSYLEGSRDIHIRNCTFAIQPEGENSIGLFINRMSDSSIPIDTVEISDIEAPTNEEAESGGILLLNVDNVSLKNISV